MENFRRILIPIAATIGLVSTSIASDYQPREDLREPTNQREFYQDTANQRNNYQR